VAPAQPPTQQDLLAALAVVPPEACVTDYDGLTHVRTEWLIERLTRLLGPVGTGWTLEVVSRLVPDPALLEVQVTVRFPAWSLASSACSVKPLRCGSEGAPNRTAFQQALRDGLGKALRNLGVAAAALTPADWFASAPTPSALPEVGAAWWATAAATAPSALETAYLSNGQPYRRLDARWCRHHARQLWGASGAAWGEEWTYAMEPTRAGLFCLVRGGVWYPSPVTAQRVFVPGGAVTLVAEGDWCDEDAAKSAQTQALNAALRLVGFGGGATWDGDADWLTKQVGVQPLVAAATPATASATTRSAPLSDAAVEAAIARLSAEQSHLGRQALVNLLTLESAGDRRRLLQRLTEAARSLPAVA
jgi:hypothetical protein